MSNDMRSVHDLQINNVLLSLVVRMAALISVSLVFRLATACTVRPRILC